MPATGRDQDGGLDEPPHEVLGVAPDAPEPVIEGAARRLKREYHPDTEGGDRERFQRIVQAEKALLNGR